MHPLPHNSREPRPIVVELAGGAAKRRAYVHFSMPWKVFDRRDVAAGGAYIAPFAMCAFPPPEARSPSGWVTDYS